MANNSSVGNVAKDGDQPESPLSRLELEYKQQQRQQGEGRTEGQDELITAANKQPEDQQEEELEDYDDYNQDAFVAPPSPSAKTRFQRSVSVRNKMKKHAKQSKKIAKRPTSPRKKDANVDDDEGNSLPFDGIGLELLAPLELDDEDDSNNMSGEYVFNDGSGSDEGDASETSYASVYSRAEEENSSRFDDPSDTSFYSQSDVFEDGSDSGSHSMSMSYSNTEGIDMTETSFYSVAGLDDSDANELNLVETKVDHEKKKKKKAKKSKKKSRKEKKHREKSKRSKSKERSSKDAAAHAKGDDASTVVMSNQKKPIKTGADDESTVQVSNKAKDAELNGDEEYPNVPTKGPPVALIATKSSSKKTSQTEYLTTPGATLAVAGITIPEATEEEDGRDRDDNPEDEAHTAIMSSADERHEKTTETKPSKLGGVTDTLDGTIIGPVNQPTYPVDADTSENVIETSPGQPRDEIPQNDSEKGADDIEAAAAAADADANILEESKATVKESPRSKVVRTVSLRLDEEGEQEGERNPSNDALLNLMIEIEEDTETGEHVPDPYDPEDPYGDHTHTSYYSTNSDFMGSERSGRSKSQRYYRERSIRSGVSGSRSGTNTRSYDQSKNGRSLREPRRDAELEWEMREAKRKRRRCFFWTLIFVFVVLMLLGIVLGVVFAVVIPAISKTGAFGSGPNVGGPSDPDVINIPVSDRDDRNCFQTRTELLQAVDDYLEARRYFPTGPIPPQDDPQFNNVTTSYGYPINSWCVTNIQDFSNLFDVFRNREAADFNEDLNDWDMSSATTLAYMFRGGFQDATSQFNSNIDDWDVTRVRDFTGTFYQAYFFNRDISRWSVDLTRVERFTNMFRLAHSFNRDLCQWGLQLSGSYVRSNAETQNMFRDTACPTKLSPIFDDPEVTGLAPGPFCYTCGGEGTGRGGR